MQLYLRIPFGTPHGVSGLRTSHFQGVAREVHRGFLVHTRERKSRRRHLQFEADGQVAHFISPSEADMRRFRPRDTARYASNFHAEFNVFSGFARPASDTPMLNALCFPRVRLASDDHWRTRPYHACRAGALRELVRHLY